MIQHRSYFFCGIGGSGMMPLALIVKGRGGAVAGSDRALDQGRTAEKFDFLRKAGIPLFPQSGEGLSSAEQTLVVSAAVEETVPDVIAARRLGAPVMRRTDLLAELFNAAPSRIAVAGTSGKSTTTAMIGWILHDAGLSPTIVNGAVMNNFVSDEIPFAGSVVGEGEDFVAEVDESDGAITLYTPDIAIVNNIALDHKSMAELRELFTAFAMKARLVVLNADNEETARLIGALAPNQAATFAIAAESADYRAHALAPTPSGISFTVKERASGAESRIDLTTPGAHNVANALAAIAVARARGVPLAKIAAALASFRGVKRRLERVGEARGVVVFDDFAHNPDKIAASLRTLREFPGRLFVLFQPHGFGPLKLMRDELIAAFAQGLAAGDEVIITEPVYQGGTTDRSVGADTIAAEVCAAGAAARYIASREEGAAIIAARAAAGDRICVMGARDDTLSALARSILAALAASHPAS